MSEDALWPRAANWLKSGTDVHTQAVSQGDTDESGFSVDLAVVGVPAHLTSISATGADATPDAIRAALMRYSTWSWDHGLDIGTLRAYDFGNVFEPDSPDGEARTSAATAAASEAAKLTLVLGGDNSVTFAAMRGVAPDLSRAALITFDAHHDLRDGISNGSPVRRLVEAGLPGNRVVQIGIADFSNSPEYANRAKGLGVHVVPRSHLRDMSPKQVWEQALGQVQDADLIYVDIDVDVCDRSVVPGCPAAAPGGLSADELRQFAYLAGNTSKVAAIDLTEIDATADSTDGRTVRLAALLMLEAASGLANRG